MNSGWLLEDLSRAGVASLLAFSRRRKIVENVSVRASGGILKGDLDQSWRIRVDEQSLWIYKGSNEDC